MTHQEMIRLIEAANIERDEMRNSLFRQHNFFYEQRAKWIAKHEKLERRNLLLALVSMALAIATATFVIILEMK